MNQYKLVGGGVDEGEEAEVAFSREAEEEAGCTISIIKRLGNAIEEKSRSNFIQVSEVFIAMAVEIGDVPHYTEKEIAEGSQVIWLSVDEALAKMKDSLDKLKDSPYGDEDVYSTSFISLRDIRILEYYKSLPN